MCGAVWYTISIYEVTCIESPAGLHEGEVSGMPSILTPKIISLRQGDFFILDPSALFLELFFDQSFAFAALEDFLV